MTTELATQVDAIAEFSDATFGIGRAKQIAGTLGEIVRHANLSVDIEGRKYLKVEAWLTLAGMCGMTARTRELLAIREEGHDTALGYRAYVEVIRVSTGEIIGGAYGRCDWAETTYSKKQQKRIPRWNEAHAVESMAQTRATAKAIAQVLRWIPTLAGFQGTPMEEMPEREPQPKAPKPPKWKLRTDDELGEQTEEPGFDTIEVQGKSHPPEEESPKVGEPAKKPVRNETGGNIGAGTSEGEWLDGLIPIHGHEWSKHTWRWLLDGDGKTGPALPGSHRWRFVSGLLEKADTLDKKTRQHCELAMMMMEDRAKQGGTSDGPASKDERTTP